MNRPYITIRMVGDPLDKGQVRLPALVTQLTAVKKALGHTERLVSHQEKSALYYRIADAHYSSPLTIVLEAVPQPPEPGTIQQPADYSQETVQTFFTHLEAIAYRKQVPPGADVPTLLAYKEMAGALEKHVAEVAILNSQVEVAINRDFQHSIDEILGPDEIVEGSITGVVEKVNLHNTNQFHIYPIVGARQVLCEFPPALMEKVREVLGNYARAYGHLKYKRLGRFPHEASVTDVELFPPEDTLPTLYDIKGIAPDLTGDKTIREFVDSIRGDEGR